MRYRSPLGRARGLGSAKEGVEHWWLQRLSAVALVPLAGWLVFALAGLAGADHAAVSAWLANPVVAVVLICLVPVLFYHSSLGVRVVAEDYIGTLWLRLAVIVGVNFLNTVLALVSILAILKVALAGWA